MMNQICADVTQKEITISEHLQTPAIGAAMFAAVATGSKNGGYDSIEEASAQMTKLKAEKVKPIPENIEKYNKLYEEFKKLHDYFGTGVNEVMKRLKIMKNESTAKE